MRALFVVFFALCWFGTVSADTPAHCVLEQYLGTWTYYLSDNSFDNSIFCPPDFPVSSKIRLTLKAPNIVIDGNGNYGNFTLTYDEGVEVHLNSRKYFAFSDWSANQTGYTSFCNATRPGWYHNSDGTNWGCFFGVQDSDSTANFVENQSMNQLYQPEVRLVEEINRNQNLWKAVVYPSYEGKTIAQLGARSGSTSSRNLGLKNMKQLKHTLSQNEESHQKKRTSRLPTNFDWRNVDGVNFVSPVRNQESCGSCYAFSTAGMLEARVRVQTNNTLQPIFSPQHVVDCSEYSQGCDGGLPYLVSKYVEDFGIYEETCYTYVGTAGTCRKPRFCTDKQRWRATNYYYVGGYYGACSAEAMMNELYSNGPMSISFDVEKDFQHYKSGIYVPQRELSEKYSINDWLMVNHAVLLVGWGEENGTPYWIVKNSWGTNWGEDGFFRIIRGIDACNVESIAVAATPVW